MNVTSMYFLAEQLMMKVTADDYLDKLVEYCILKLYAVASVSETNQTWADEDDFQVLKPKIDIRVIALIETIKLNVQNLLYITHEKLDVFWQIFFV